MQPYTGVSFEATIFLQSNYYYEPDYLFRYDDSAMLPMFSLYRAGNLTESVAQDLFGPLNVGFALEKGILIAGIVLGVVFISTLIYFSLRIRKINAQMKGQKESDKKDNKNTINVSMQEPKTLMREIPEEEQMERGMQEPKTLLREFPEENEIEQSRQNEVKEPVKPSLEHAKNHQMEDETEQGRENEREGSKTNLHEIPEEEMEENKTG